MSEKKENYNKEFEVIAEAFGEFYEIVNTEEGKDEVVNRFIRYSQYIEELSQKELAALSSSVQIWVK